MLKAYKFRLYPNKEQENILKQFIGTSRFIYNHYLYESVITKISRVAKHKIDLWRDKVPVK